MKAARRFKSRFHRRRPRTRSLSLGQWAMGRMGWEVGSLNRKKERESRASTTTASSHLIVCARARRGEWDEHEGRGSLLPCARACPPSGIPPYPLPSSFFPSSPAPPSWRARGPHASQFPHESGLDAELRETTSPSSDDGDCSQCDSVRAHFTSPFPPSLSAALSAATATR